MGAHSHHSPLQQGDPLHIVPDGKNARFVPHIWELKMPVGKQGEISTRLHFLLCLLPQVLLQPSCSPHAVHSALATPAAWIWLLQQSHSELLCWTATIFAKKHKWEKEAALVSSVQQENKSNSRAVSSSRIYGQGEENLSRKRLLELLFSAVKLGNNSKTTPFQAPTTNLRQVRKLSVSPQKNNLQQD